jgi:hypothetical protein
MPRGLAAPRAEQHFVVRVDAKAAAPGGLNMRQEPSCVLSRVARDRAATRQQPRHANAFAKARRFREAFGAVPG